MTSLGGRSRKKTVEKKEQCWDYSFPREIGAGSTVSIITPRLFPEHEPKSKVFGVLFGGSSVGGTRSLVGAKEKMAALVVERAQDALFKLEQEVQHLKDFLKRVAERPDWYEDFRDNKGVQR